MKIVIANDHVAVELKNHIRDYLVHKGWDVTDFGTNSPERVDYPAYGKKAGQAVARGEYGLGILICGTGVGISLAANKIRGVRAAVCSEPYTARMARCHNDANIIAFGARVVGPAMAEMIVDAFLEAEYEGGRHQRRVDMISAIEKGAL